MEANNDEYLRHVNRKINGFSGQFMNNDKWLKVFKVLSAHRDMIGQCIIVSIHESRPMETYTPPPADQINKIFNSHGFNDVLGGRPMLFKEIKLLKFPASWDASTPTDDGSPQTVSGKQNLDVIALLLNQAGYLAIERDARWLYIYAYK